MRTSARSSGRAASVAATGLLLLALAVGCGPRENAELADAFRALPLAEAAKQVAAGYGTVVAVHEGRGIPVVMFQEEHSSILQQAQIAAMLNRLYERFGLRTIGLEGACVGEFTVPKAIRGDHEAGARIGEREVAAVQMLAGGEISGPELLAVVYPDIQLEAVEKADLYGKQERRPQAAATPTYYLALVAFFSMPQEEQARIFALDQEERARALLDGIDGNPTTKELMEAYSTSCCCDVTALNRIASLAAERKVATRQEIDADFAYLRDSDETACRRGQSIAHQMISKVLPTASRRGEAVAALACGAAHCEIPEEFAKAGRSYVAIRAAAFELESDPSRLSSDDLGRKYERLPVVHSDVLRRALAGEQVEYKYGPVIDTLWARAQLDVRVLTSRIAHLVAGGDVPPLTQAALAGLPATYCHVIPGSLHVDRGEAVFAIETLSENATPTTIWIRAAVDRVAAEQTLDERLGQLIEDLAQGVEQGREVTATLGTTAVAASADVKAVFCISQQVADSVPIAK